MSQERRRRRLLAKTHLRMLRGGKPEAAPTLSHEATPQDRLGEAVMVLVQQMRRQPEACDPAQEVKVLLQVAAKLADRIGADVDQFAAVAAHVYDEYLHPTAQPPGA